MKTVDEIDGKELKAVCKSLNDQQIAENIRYVGVKLPVILDAFVKAIEDIEDGHIDNIPTDVVDFYNDLIADEVVDPADSTTSEDGEEGPAMEPEEPIAEPVTDTKPKKKDKPKKERKKSTSIRVGRTVYKDFAAYEKSLREEGPETPTNYLDLVFLDGATTAEVVDLFAEFVKDNKLKHGGYKRPALVMEHIVARTKNAGFTFAKDGDKYTLIGAAK